MTPVRLAAARALARIERGGVTMAAAVDQVRRLLDDPRDRALLLELVGGTLRWRGELDALIEQAARRRVASLDAPVRAVLRLGAYQLRHLERVPPHAVVSEAVDGARATGAARAAGFVNAVLRAMTRQASSLTLPARPAADAPRDAQVAYLSTTMSHPAWLVERWLDRLPFDEVARWCEHNNASPAITVRAHGVRLEAARAALAAAGVAADPARYVTSALRLPPGALGSLSPGLRAGLVVQDEGAQLVALACDARPGERALDLCAAPGGKTLLLARAIAPGGGLVAADRRQARVALLSARLAAAGVEASIVRLDAARPLPLRPVFDLVLLDAPCSGLGTLSRDPDVKWSRTPADLDAFAATQRTMLREAAAVVRPGGRLAYATCSSEPEENSGIVDGFLDERPEFELRPVTFPPEVARPGELVDARGCLRTLPSRHGIDAYFTAVLARRAAA